MKLSPFLPFFHDGFTGYGFNRIEHFEELRMRGVRMRMVMKSFLMKPLHIMSQAQMEFAKQYMERSNSSAEILYRRLQKRWSDMYSGIHNTTFCSGDETQFV